MVAHHLSVQGPTWSALHLPGCCCCTPLLTQNVSNAAWAFGSLGVSHQALFGALAAAAKACQLEGYNHQNITDLAWGTAQAGHTVRPLGCAVTIERSVAGCLSVAAPAWTAANAVCVQSWGVRDQMQLVDDQDGLFPLFLLPWVHKYTYRMRGCLRRSQPQPAAACTSCRPIHSATSYRRSQRHAPLKQTRCGGGQWSAAYSYYTLAANKVCSWIQSGLRSAEARPANIQSAAHFVQSLTDWLVCCSLPPPRVCVCRCWRLPSRPSSTRCHAST